MRALDPDLRNSDAWRDAAHTLKGSALGVGAVQLAEVCATAEQAAGLSSVERTFRLDRVRDAMDATLSDIAAYAHEQALRSLKSPSAWRQASPEGWDQPPGHTPSVAQVPDQFGV